MPVDRCDDAVEAALAAAAERGVYVILRIQELLERRLVVVDGGVERQRTTRLAGIGIHALTPDGSIGFASVDDVSPEAARAAVQQAGALAKAAGERGADRSDAPFRLQSSGRARFQPANGAENGAGVADQTQTVIESQDALGGFDLGQGRTVRTTLRAVDDEWRIVRSDGTDLGFSTPRASLRHDLTGRSDGTIARAAATVSS